MMGTEEDPTDGKAVASSIFIAVAVYGVCSCSSRRHSIQPNTFIYSAGGRLSDIIVESSAGRILQDSG